MDRRHAMETIGHQDLQHLHLLENVTFQPVFILGLHRSGTSILYKMLTATDCFNPVTAYHLIKYHQLLQNHMTKHEEYAKQELTRFFKEQGQLDRGIDRLQLTADFAEEYGFILGKQTFAMNITNKNKALFIEMVKKIQYISNNRKPILLKNPYDFSNFLYIKKEFPNAKFVFIHRHPFPVLSSTIKAMRLLLKEKNTYTTELFRLYNEIFENPLLLFISRLLVNSLSFIGMGLYAIISAKSANYYLKNISKLPMDDYIAITYEHLCANPQETMNDVLQLLEIQKSKNIDFNSFIKPRKTELDDSVKKMKRFIYARMKKYFTAFNYLPDIKQ